MYKHISFTTFNEMRGTRYQRGCIAYVLIYETETNLTYSTHILHYICAKKEICEFGKVLFIASKIDKVGFMAFG